MSLFSDAKRVLVVVAHPDDEVLGCGGTIARFLASGAEVHVLILGGITTSRYKGKASEESWKEKAFKGEAEKCADRLKLTSLTRCNFKDNRFDSIPLLSIIKAVEKIKAQVKPDAVMTHDFSDLNIDHRLTHQAVMTAFRPEGRHALQCIMTFETPSSTEWQDQEKVSFKPNCYVDITRYLAQKINAVKCYKSELKKSPHPRSLEGITVLAKKRGTEICLKHAEAFRIVRGVL
ncbi:MAG: PIG-L family deacetylase [Candidatus Omnitrophica bacterium]|nr:PIG-L family deacetylase [Candidatus Omnitrophota bacterium]